MWVTCPSVKDKAFNEASERSRRAPLTGAGAVTGPEGVSSGETGARPLPEAAQEPLAWAASLVPCRSRTQTKLLGTPVARQGLGRSRGGVCASSTVIQTQGDKRGPCLWS